MKTVSLLFWVSGLVMMLATLLPLLRFRHWLVRGLDFPRLQILIAIGLLMLCAVLFLPAGLSMHGVWWVSLLVCFLTQLWWVWPNSTLHRQEVPTATDAQQAHSHRLSLITSNVLMTNREVSVLLSQISHHQPDIVITLESDQWWEEQLTAALSHYPHRIACALDNQYGLHVFSRYPLNQARIEYLVEDDVPSASARVILNKDAEVHLHVVHPRPPAPGENSSSIERDVELLVLARELETLDVPVIVAGDLNDVAWSRTTRLFRRVSRLLDVRTGRGMFNTFNADYWFARWPLDHVFVSSHFRVGDIQRLGHIGSDHFPMYVELLLTAPGQIDSPESLQPAEHDLIRDTLETPEARDAVSPGLGR